jgi:hypothetical protein
MSDCRVISHVISSSLRGEEVAKAIKGMFPDAEIQKLCEGTFEANGRITTHFSLNGQVYEAVCYPPSPNA